MRKTPNALNTREQGKDGGTKERMMKGREEDGKEREGAFGGLYRRAKFGSNRCSSFNNMHVFQFQQWLGNAYSRPQNWGFGGI